MSLNGCYYYYEQISHVKQLKFLFFSSIICFFISLFLFYFTYKYINSSNTEEENEIE